MIYPCYFCSEALISIPELVTHHRQNHETQALPFYMCDHCDFVTEKLSNAKEHSKTIHGIEKYQPYKCQYCETSTRGRIGNLQHGQRKDSLIQELIDTQTVLHTATL